jgi:hypothetical protein
MGGKGAQPDNSQVVAMQQQQAAQTAEATKQTNARLQEGMTEINQLFGGAPSGSTLLDLSSLANANPYTGTTPAGDQPYSPGVTTTSQVPVYGPSSPYSGNTLNTNNTINTSSAPTLNTNNTINASAAPRQTGTKTVTSTTGGSPGGALGDGYTWAPLADTGGPQSYGIFDSKGNLVSDATSLSDLAASKIYVGGDPSTTTGGFDDDFYNKFTNAQLDYYMPAEDRQFGQAQTNLDYGLARAGTLNSSIADTQLANLTYQDTLNKAQIQSTADTATAQLRDTVASDKNTAINQLYATENPSTAASTAAGLVGNVQLTTPQLNPIGQLFTPIAVGTGNAIAGYTNPASYLPATGGGTAATGSGATGSSNVIPG